jgi:repressor LexA
VEYPSPPRGGFAVRVTGDSMEPDYHEGDMIVLDPAKRAVSGEVGVIRYEDPAAGVYKARLKRLVFMGKKVVLKSLNPRYADVILDASAVKNAYGISDYLPFREAARMQEIGHDGPE